MIVKLEELVCGDRVGKGGQGTIYEVSGSFLKRMGWRHAVVLKRYGAYLGADALAAFDHRSDWAIKLPASARDDLFRAACWPLAAVEDRGMLAGIVMPDERARHGATMELPSGTRKDVLMSLEHLLEEDDFTERRFELTSDTRVRATIAERMATSLAVLHRHSIVVSDFSHRNVLVRLLEPFAVTLIDCDSMRFQGETSLKAVETPDWDIPEAWNEAASTRAADSYKLGLAVLRLFARKQGVRHLGEAERHVPTPLRGLLASALGQDARLRPAAGRWQSSLRDVLGTDLNRDFPGPPRKPNGASAIGPSWKGVKTVPTVTIATPIVTVPSPLTAATTPLGATGGPQSGVTPGTWPGSPPLAGKNATGAPASVHPRRGPMIAAAVIACTAIVAYAAIGSAGSSHENTPSAQQLATAVGARHLISISGPGEAKWIRRQGGHLWAWNPVDSSLVRVNTPVQAPLYASVYWRGRYAARQFATSSSTKPATSRQPKHVHEPVRNASVTTGGKARHAQLSASSGGENHHSVAAPALSTSTGQGKSQVGSGSSGGLAGHAESAPPPRGGGLEGKAESESQSHSGGGLSGAGE